MRRFTYIRNTTIAAGAFAMVLAGCGSGDTDTRSDATGAPGGETGTEGGETPSGSVVLYSTQFNPVEEADAIRREVIDKFSGDAEFVGAPDEGQFIDRVTAEAESGQGEISLLGGLHGTFVDLQEQGLLTDLSDLAGELAELGVPEDLLELGKVGTDQQWYIPWAQASYVGAAHRDALEYLPEGADVMSLSYDEYLEWAANTAEAEGAPRFGFPAGEEGLMHRFLQGYLIPSFSGGVVRTFDDPAGWEYLAELWQYVHPQSLTYEFMEDPLRGGEVLVAWDHVARLGNALESQPDDFVVFPVPSGPDGRAHMPVVAGLAIPQSAPNPEGAADLLRHMLAPESQVATMNAVGFYPVVDTEGVGTEVSPGTQLTADAVEQQATADDALLVLLPVGLGDQGGTFSDIYRAAFERVINGEDPASAVAAEADRLTQVMEDSGAPCWAPDEPSEGACPVGTD